MKKHPPENKSMKKGQTPFDNWVKKRNIPIDELLAIRQKHFERFKKHVSPFKDGPLDLTILKVHLLIEELLRQYIKERLPNGGVFDDDRFKFRQLINLAKCLHNPGDDTFDWLWPALDQLNTIRNKMAHHLEPKDQDKKIAKLLKYVRENFVGSWPVKLIKGFGKERIVLFILWDEVSALVRLGKEMEILTHDIPENFKH
jgi:hypothetical protein